MNRFLALCFIFLSGLPALAQNISDGYYRVQNMKSERYIVMIDNKSKGLNATTTTYDMDALLTIKPFSRVASDPGSVIYIEHHEGNQYNLKAQGADAHAIVGRYLTLTPMEADTYYASATEAGLTLYLFDTGGNSIEGRLTTQKTGTEFLRRWYIKPVSATDDDNYFGIPGEVSAGGKTYSSLFASFPFTFASSGMKAYTVTKLDGNLAVMTEVNGKVAAKTPVIIACAGSADSDNRLNIEMQNTAAPSGNLLQGVYFENSEVDFIDGNESAFHFNATKYDPNTMRLLGTTTEGKLGFVKADVTYIPKNRAYLTVPAGAPDEITLLTQDEYNAEIAKDVVIITARNYTREYGEGNPTFEYDVTGTGTLQGQPAVTCDATPSSPVGNYPIFVSVGTVTNHQFTGINGTLTVKAAPLTVKARSYTILQGGKLPQFAYDVTGFKLGQTEEVLTTKPVISCNVPDDMAPGTYPITVSGAVAPNYDITYVAGTLTIQEAPLITVTATSQGKVYGDANPALTYTIEGGTLTGTPYVTCEATRDSEPGVYTIVISQGTLEDYPNLTFVNGTLTVTKAPLSISAGGPYTMKQSDERPEFKPTFEGFKLGQDETILDKQPVLTTDAPDDNAPGEYTVSVSGAESGLYYFLYKSGKFIITEADQILIVANDATMTYGDEVPQLSYTVSGGELTGEPVVSCVATSRSDAGVYDIIVEQGTVDYPNIKLVNGTLTVTKAPLTASVGNYSREEGEENPVFEIIYEGFRNGDTPEVFTVAPVATTTATVDSSPGSYEIVVSGGEARNYDFTYVNGRLTVVIPESVMAVSFTHPVDVYTVSGRRVRSQVTSVKGLPRGVYIIEGRKVVVK